MTAELVGLLALAATLCSVLVVALSVRTWLETRRIERSINATERSINATERAIKKGASR